MPASRFASLAFASTIVLGCATEPLPAGPAPAPGLPDVDPLVERGELETLAEEIAFGEGPLWIDNQLLFCEFKSDRIRSFSTSGELDVFREPAGGPAGLARSPDGALYTAELTSRRVTRTEADGSITVVADGFEGRRLNGPNDLVFAADGTLYFTDPQLPYVSDFELDFAGVFRIDPSGNLSLVYDGLLLPNGIALSPDESILYVVGTIPAEVIAIDLVNGVPAGAPRVLIEKVGILPDGMTVDEYGNLYVSAGEGVSVFSPSGALRGIIETPSPANNCAFGGADGSTLFILTEETLHAVDLQVSGLP